MHCKKVISTILTFFWFTSVLPFCFADDKINLLLLNLNYDSTNISEEKYNKISDLVSIPFKVSKDIKIIDNKLFDENIDSNTLKAVSTELKNTLSDKYLIDAIISGTIIENNDSINILIELLEISSNFHIIKNIKFTSDENTNKIEIYKWSSGVISAIKTAKNNGRLVNKNIGGVEKIINRTDEALTNINNDIETTEKEISNDGFYIKLSNKKRYSNAWRALFTSGMVFSSIGTTAIISGGVLWGRGTSLLNSIYDVKTNSSDMSSPIYREGSNYMTAGFLSFIGGGISQGLGVVLGLVSIPFIVLVKFSEKSKTNFSFYSSSSSLNEFTVGFKISL